MWVLVVVFLSANTGFSIPGYSSDDTCERAGNEFWSKVNIQFSKQKIGGAPKLYTYCTKVD